MRKSALQKILEETEMQLKAALNENEMLTQKLSDTRAKLDAAESCDTEGIDEISKLKAENEKLMEKLAELEAKHKAEQDLLNAQATALKEENAKLKGEIFDIGTYADELKMRLEAATTPIISEPDENDEPEKQVSAPLNPPPHITKPYTADNIPQEIFDYASVAISKAIVKSSTLKSVISESNSTLKNELMPLAIGKTEMFKSDVLQIVVSTAEDNDKRLQIDNLFNETIEYYDSLLGQIK